MTVPDKVAIIGLDGVPFSLLERFFAEGYLPRLAEMADRGTFVKMQSTLPAISSVAWTSFMTGTNPGEHGIYGFTDLKSGEIALRLPSFDDVQCAPLWQQAGTKKSVVVNLPFTYPARPLDGVLVAGFVAPVFERAVYPPRLIPWLRSMKYRTDVDSVAAREDRRVLIRDLFDTLHVHAEVMSALLAREPWDLFIGVVTGTDRLHHFLFDAHDNPSHPFFRDFIDYYRAIDFEIGRLLDRIGPNCRVIVLSDHGFTRLHCDVQLNYILRTLGVLYFSRANPQSPADIARRSLAFAMDPTRIYLHSRERFRSGTLSPAACTELRGRLKHDLERMRLADVGIRVMPGTDADEPLFDRILVQEEIYRGGASELAPDLVVVPRRGYDVKASLRASAATSRDIFTGMHTHDDAFLIVDDPLAKRRLPQPEIAEVAGLALEVLRGQRRVGGLGLRAS
ncbi:MAG: alkaline phosphatase family protein [Desulfomonile tiedjei]|nr:alkaline phosphatase family protein [Desulfomonile tiedjei]